MEIFLFSPECQKIFDQIPEESYAMVIEGLKLLQSPADFSPDTLLSILKEVFSIEIKDTTENKYHFPDSPLKTSLALELASDEPELSIRAMAIVVAKIKERYQKKGIDFNCFVFLDTDLDPFFHYLENSKNQLQNKTRIQILSLNKNNKHWSVLDIRINEGILEFYLLDAVLINKICHIFVIKYSSVNIQTDLTNCAIFTLDHAIQLAKILDFHDKPNNVKSYPYTKGGYIQFIPLENFLPEFSPLLRNMQSLKKLTKLSIKINGLLGNSTLDIDSYLNTKDRKKTNH